MQNTMTEDTTGQSVPVKKKRAEKGDAFRKVASKTSKAMGSPSTFMAALAIVVVWAASGRLFHYSDTWQLVINTGTTIVTFLMVFLIQNTQNRDSHALHLKLDELIHANKHARNHMMALDELSDRELAELQEEFDKLACEKVMEVRAKSQRAPQSMTNEVIAQTR